jgi:hypothetical protein
MGSSASSADEWIELYNTGETTQDLSQWTLTRLTDEGEQVMLVIESGQINPGETFLIANYSSDHKNTRLESLPQLVNAALSLPNSKLQLRLYTGQPDTGAILIDIADDGSGIPLAGDSEQKRSMVRIQFHGDGTKQKAGPRQRKRVVGISSPSKWALPALSHSNRFLLKRLLALQCRSKVGPRLNNPRCTQNSPEESKHKHKKGPGEISRAFDLR